jgi:hypothetical protein
MNSIFMVAPKTPDEKKPPVLPRAAGKKEKEGG